MTVTPEQIREAVELADGWERHGTVGWSSPLGWLDGDTRSREELAALASQLISQVDALDDCLFTSECGRAEILIRPIDKIRPIRAHGPNRDENSILACTQFLREKGNE